VARVSPAAKRGSQRRRRPSRQDRRRPLLGWGFLFGLALSCGFGTLVYLSSLHLEDVDLSLTAPLAFEPNWQEAFRQRIDQITADLQKTSLPLPAPAEEPRGSGRLRWVHRRYTFAPVNLRKIDSITTALQPIQTSIPGITLVVNETDDETEVQIGVDGLLTHTLVFPRRPAEARVAIIIDDLGNNLLDGRRLIQIEPPVALAVLPFRPFSRQVAELAHLFGREVLLHLPMEAQRGDGGDTAGLLRVSAERGEIDGLVNDALHSVPGAIGVNNHMGSRFTENREHLTWVLEELKQHNLFFIDSRTSGDSVVCEVAAGVGVPCRTRAVFLDNVDDPGMIRAQFDHLAQLARTGGDVIAIGHPRPNTLDVLTEVVPRLESSGVQVVPVSTLMADEFLSGR
jgi:hypothetical protein